MASCDDYSVGWVCALPVEVAAAKAALDHLHDKLTVDRKFDDDNNYILGSLCGHNVVIAYSKAGLDGQTSTTKVAKQLSATFRFIRLHIMVGVASGVPETKEDIRLGDVVVGRSIAGRPSLLQYEVNGERPEVHSARSRTLYQPPPFLLTATSKAETAAIFDESQMSQYLSSIIRKDPITFACPGSEKDVLFDDGYNHPAIECEERGCRHCNPDRIRSRLPRKVPGPVVHYGTIASGHHLMQRGATRDEFAREHSVICFETEAAGLNDAAPYLIIRGICDYADSHNSKLWHGYAAAAAAAYTIDVLSFVPTIPKITPLTANKYAEAAPVLDALLLTRPEVDRRALIALKGRRVDGTCEWLTTHPNYQKWLTDNANSPLLWISGGPGKGKTMLAIFITEVLQQTNHDDDDVLLYYFCSNRDKNRNNALAIMRGIIHQWVDLRPHLAQYIKDSFEGTETTKYTVSNFASLWRAFLNLLRHSTSSPVVCVLDGLDECQNDSLVQLLNAIGNYFSSLEESLSARFKLIVFSRPQPAVLERKLGKYEQIKLDEVDMEISQDVEKYISAKVSELAVEQDLSEEMIAEVQQTLVAGADGTFLWVGFVANDLQGKRWEEMNQLLRRLPRGLRGVYQRLLQQIDDKETLAPLLQWIVLAARPLTLQELAQATEIRYSATVPATEVVKNRLALCGLLVKIEGNMVNLIHESAKEFFQSDQVNVNGISLFRVDRHTHRALMRKCLDIIEREQGAQRRFEEKPGQDSFLSYAGQYWPLHLYYAGDAIDEELDFSRPFFEVDSPIREEWWKSFWAWEKNGGNPPSFTLLHLAAYLGNISWAKMLITKHTRAISRKDNYGRTPLSWAVSRGHGDMVKLLLGHGARVNAKDRSEMTALHIAVTGQHKDIVLMLLDEGARPESKTDHGDTALIRAIQTNSREIVQILLQYGSRVHELPVPPGRSSLKGPASSLDERVDELMSLQEQIFLARYRQASRKVNIVMKTMSLSFRFPIILQLATLYLKFVAFDRWEHMTVLQELVQENKTSELRQWAEVYREFFVQLIVARNPGRLTAMTDLPTQVFRQCAPGDLQALLVIAVLVGSEAKLAAVRYGWREGDLITARAFANWSTIAFNRDAEEFLHYGVREFLNDFNTCIQSGNREESVARTVVLLTSHFAMLENKEIRPIEYFSRVVAEFYEGYIGGSYEFDLFSDAVQGCANELMVIGANQDGLRLRLFLTSIFEFAQRSQTKGRDRFFDIPAASCLTLCRENAHTHQWLIVEAIPETLSVLISEQPLGPLQKRASKALVECLLIGKQYGLALPALVRQRMDHHLDAIPGVKNMVYRSIGL